jgi:hypothetical protein
MSATWGGVTAFVASHLGLDNDMVESGVSGSRAILELVYTQGDFDGF